MLKWFKNNRIYVGLLLCAIALTGISLFFQENGAVFTIWTSVSCGGIASILVAWLIDAANRRQLAENTLNKRKALLRNLYHVFENDLQLLIYKSVEIDYCLDSKKWYEWIETVKKQAMHDPAIIRTFIRDLIVFFDDLAEQVLAVKSQEAILLEAEIICQKDIQALSTILNLCNTMKAIVRLGDSDDVCFSHFCTNCGLIRGIIDYAPSLRPINDIMIEPTLYCLYRGVQSEKPGSEDRPNDHASDEEHKEFGEGEE